jgi:hypothetical protein
MRFYVCRRRRRCLKVIAPTTPSTCAQTRVARDGCNTSAQTRVRERFTSEHVVGIVLLKRAAHASELTFVRQIARKPQPPIELLIVHFR